jgi:hypothetical protein
MQQSTHCTAQMAFPANLHARHTAVLHPAYIPTFVQRKICTGNTPDVNTELWNPWFHAGLRLLAQQQ